MQTQQNNNLFGSKLYPSDIPIPPKFIVSEGILQDTSGKNITISVIFDPAATTNFIQKSLLIELGWALESTNYSVLQMNDIESANSCSTNCGVRCVIVIYNLFLLNSLYRRRYRKQDRYTLLVFYIFKLIY